VVLYGDNFVESWRGTAGGKPNPACAGIPDVWQRHFGGLWRARAYGITGVHAIATLSVHTLLTWYTLCVEPTEGPAAPRRAQYWQGLSQSLYYSVVWNGDVAVLRTTLQASRPASCCGGCATAARRSGSRRCSCCTSAPRTWTPPTAPGARRGRPPLRPASSPGAAPLHEHRAHTCARCCLS
jgi:hypothetical protein